MRIAWALLLLATGSTFGQAPAVSCSDTAAIDKFVASLNEQRKARPQRKFDHPLYPDKAPWREVIKWNDEELADHAIVFTTQSVWFDLASESGDGTQEVDFFFRQDGSLAKRQDELGTFHGEITAIRETWFDCGGKELKTTRRYYALGTNTPATPGPDFHDLPVPLYNRLTDLPFYALLAGSPQGKGK